MEAAAVLERHLDELMAVPGVEGVGIGGSADAPVIVIMVNRGGAAMRKKLPLELEGVPVTIEVTGEIKAL